MEDDLLPIGKVMKAHGVRGGIKVKYYGGDLNQACHYRKVILRDKAGVPKTYDVLEASVQPPSGLLLRLKGIEERGDAEVLVGREILIRRDDLPGLEEDEFYYVDLLGMRVETEEGKGIGTVKEIFPTGAQDVFVIEGRRGEICIPATEEVVRGVDRDRRVIRVHRMEGLWEAEDEV